MGLNKKDFIEWHEGVIVQYPVEIQSELRNARTKWLAGIKEDLK